MNIKKIIREEINDFEWTDLGGDFIQVNSNNVYKGMKVMINPESKLHVNAPYKWGKVISGIQWYKNKAYVGAIFNNHRDIYRIGPNNFDLLTIKNINESQEGITDLEWMMEIGPYDIFNKNWIIHFDVDCDLDEVRRIQEWIYSQGFVWASNATIEQMSADCDSKYYFREYTDDIQFDAYAKFNEQLQEMIDRGFVLYNWSDIRNTIQINESKEDGFNWIQDTSYEDILDNHFNIETNEKETWFKGIKDRNNIHPAYELYNKLSYSKWSDLYNIMDKYNKLWSMDKGIIKRLRIANKLDNWRIDRLNKLKDYYPMMYKKQLRNVTP